MAEVAPPKVAEVLSALEALRSQATGHAARVVQIENAPPAVLRLSLGHVIHAEVIDTNKSGQFLLRTAAGLLQATNLTDKLQLPNGTQLALKIFTQNPTLRAHLDILQRPALSPTASPHIDIADTVSRSQGIAARLLAAPTAPQGVAVGAGIAAGAGGEPLLVTLRVVTGAPAGAPAAAMPPSPQAAASLAALQGGEAQSVTGQVIRTSGGQTTLLQTPLGRIETSTPLPLRPGDQIQLTVELSPQAKEAPTYTTRAAPAFLPGQPWSSLDEVAQMLTAENRQLLAFQPSQSTASQARDLPLLRLLISLAGGEPQPWQSAALVAGLHRAGRAELAGQIEDEHRLAAQTVADDRGEWRLSMTPFLQDERLHALRFYRRDSGDQTGGSDEDGHATRFVVELDLSRYGQFQMDGLVNGKRFDLAIRSRRGLTAPIQQDLREIYERATEAAGLTGQILFDDGPEWRSMPLPGGRPPPVQASV